MDKIQFALSQITHKQMKIWATAHKKPIIIPCPIIPCPACEAKIKTDKRIHFASVDRDGKLIHASMAVEKYNWIVFKEKVRFFFINLFKKFKGEK